MKTISKVISSAALLLLSSCSTLERGQLADVGTTFIALERGFVEGNPLMSGLNIPWMLAAKMAYAQTIKWLIPEPYCTPSLWIGGTIGYGAAFWNIGVMAGSGPAGVGVFLIASYLIRDQTIASARYTCTHRDAYVPVEIDFGLNPNWFNDKF